MDKKLATNNQMSRVKSPIHLKSTIFLGELNYQT
ncbi:hypothetical protein EMA8858_03345 [Emticicia aquatica]|uniref:Uncharacterized protein n=1 Tax=Emticicia aquatica TaxID=1681835 RepID=A0ABN8EZP8_9BACT|nr:hypothetical protein EMA8858_03345 [Emticicia aquatica]